MDSTGFTGLVGETSIVGVLSKVVVGANYVKVIQVLWML